jgi:DNA polymerase III epsilon subunit-like protein
VSASARYVFLDIETTGLEPYDQITECAFINHEGEEKCWAVRHDRLPSPWVLENTDYLTRIVSAPKISRFDLAGHLRAACDAETHLVGAGPAFDDRFLRTLYKSLNISVPWSHRLIDVETMAMAIFHLDRPPALKDIRGLLGLPPATAPAHNALNDAREAKLVFEAMRSLVASVPFIPKSASFGIIQASL